MYPTDTIFQVKQKLSLQYDVQQDVQRLYFKGDKLDNSCTVAGYSIKNGDVVNVFIALCAAAIDGESLKLEKSFQFHA